MEQPFLSWLQQAADYAIISLTYNMKGSVIMPLPQKSIYTIADIYALPEGTRAELIDSQIYYQASPSRTHQIISKELVMKIDSFIKSTKGKCEVYSAPFDVFLNGNESECYIPDISVICNPDILQERGCFGAPDWIIEITSPSTSSHDYLLKSVKYQAAGVREYWIVNPQRQAITVYDFTDENFIPQLFTFQDKVKVNIYDNLWIDFQELNL